jgi:eukaryotic-like serine/threonine-protein kinase
MPMRVCPTCRQIFAAGIKFCPYDGHALDEAEPAVTEVPSDDLLGQLLAERYRLETRLGEGGMGVVYGGRHIIIDKRVAVKVLRSEYCQDERQAERFLREAKAASRIGHPNIVDITDFGSLPNGQIFLVMEFLVGHTLAWEIRKSAIPAGRCIHLGVQICHALAAAHAKGIVHRDLKPENIFLCNPSTAATAERMIGHPEDTIKLLDFGIAKFALEADGKRLTRAGSVFGTPQYMSPEQAAGQDADHRLDIYAMGCILYEMLTGELPFNADTFMGTLSKQLFEAPKPPHELRPDLHIRPALEAVVLKAMQKQADDRYQSALELCAALVACAEHGDLPASDTVPEEEEEAAPPPAPAIAPAPAPLVPPPMAAEPTELVAAPLDRTSPISSRGPGALFWVPLLLVVLGAGGFVTWQLTRTRSTKGPEPKKAEPAQAPDGRAIRPLVVDAAPRAPDRSLTPDVSSRPLKKKGKKPAPTKVDPKWAPGKVICPSGLKANSLEECK